jgi:hypothetical protein
VDAFLLISTFQIVANNKQCWTYGGANRYPGALMPAYFWRHFPDFANTTEQAFLQELTEGYAKDKYCDLKMLQYEAWRYQFNCLKAALKEISLHGFKTEQWAVLVEFPIPRRMGRVDTIILIGDAIIVLEFKGETVDNAAAIQVTDYALDLAYFHRPSHLRPIYPVVVGRSEHRGAPATTHADDHVQGVRFVSSAKLHELLLSIAREHDNRKPVIGAALWNDGEYFPVPTIVEAAIGMFSEMEVDDIAHAAADPKNLGKTIDVIRNIVADAASERRKVVLFVTGVPGAGKTLAGLKLVHDPIIRKLTGSEIAFLSGNGPLVAVLRAALALDIKKRKRINAHLSRRNPKTLIQSVYGFKNYEWPRNDPPVEKVFVFDEAQRAWDYKTNIKKLKQDADESKVCSYSEPALILHVLDRHRDWAALICLIGGGQEIHTGEAGLAEWGRALQEYFPHWTVFASPNAVHGDKTGTQITLFGAQSGGTPTVAENADLHLDNPMRQFRAKTVAKWTESVLSRDTASASAVLTAQDSYPCVITRSPARAKQWLEEQARGSERYGLIASSSAKRLRAYGIHVPGVDARDVEHWFLGPKGDVRSSFQLETAATEFHVQGLELDFVGVCWGGDFLIDDQGNWDLRDFVGTKWMRVKNTIRRAYVVNTYRVLLTRARQGIVIFVPRGIAEDPTTTPDGYDRTADFLAKCGVQSLD